MLSIINLAIVKSTVREKLKSLVEVLRAYKFKEIKFISYGIFGIEHSEIDLN